VTSPVDICNMALTLIGKPPINALSEARAEAVACRMVYDPMRRMLLQSSAWTFSLRRLALARLSDNGFSARWDYAYARPADALTILRVMHPELAPVAALMTPSFEVREQRIYTNQPDAVCDYVFDLADASRFSPLFVEALAHRVAERLARNLTRSGRLAQEMDEAARMALSRAVTADAAQSPQTYLYGNNAHSPDYNDARRLGWALP